MKNKLDAITVNKIIDKLFSLSKTNNNIEVTLEANPTSIESQKFVDFNLRTL